MVAASKVTWSQLSQNIQPGFEGFPSATFSIGHVAFVYFAGPDQNFWMYITDLN
ncbi:MAG: hypothetical protein OEM26_13590 [Saprospiraceae bacterium]|nr:hypothetical protein [Saprospiraceae bacterium]